MSADSQPESSNVNELAELVKLLSPVQLDFVRYRLELKTDKEAAKEAGVAAETVSRWKSRDGVPIDDILRLVKADGIVLAMERLRRLAPKAIDVLDDEMNKGEKRRLDAAQEVLDRVIGKASQKLEHTGAGGEPIELVVREVIVEIPSDEPLDS